MRLGASLALACVLSTSASALELERRWTAHNKEHNKKSHAISQRSGKSASKKNHSSHASTGGGKSSGGTPPAKAQGGGGGYTPAPSQGGGGGWSPGKCGLSWTWHDIDQGPFFSDCTSWTYDWKANTQSWPADKTHNHRLTYIPQFWGQKSISDWKNNVMGQSWKAVLGFNEPNIASQGNMSPGTAAALWKQYIEPVDAQVKISPSVTSDITGLKWMQEFMEACDGCTIDKIGFHHYDVTAQSFIDRANVFWAAFPGKRLYVTECGCHSFRSNPTYCDMGKARAMVSGIMEWVNGAGDEIVETIAWYQFAPPPTNINPANLMMVSTGDNKWGPTDLAQLFLGL